MFVQCDDKLVCLQTCGLGNPETKTFSDTKYCTLTHCNKEKSEFHYILQIIHIWLVPIFYPNLPVVLFDGPNVTAIWMTVWVMCLNDCSIFILKYTPSLQDHAGLLWCYIQICSWKKAVQSKNWRIPINASKLPLIWLICEMHLHLLKFEERHFRVHSYHRFLCLVLYKTRHSLHNSNNLNEYRKDCVHLVSAWELFDGLSWNLMLEVLTESSSYIFANVVYCSKYCTFLISFSKGQIILFIFDMPQNAVIFWTTNHFWYSYRPCVSCSRTQSYFLLV